MRMPQSESVKIWPPLLRSSTQYLLKEEEKFSSAKKQNKKNLNLSSGNKHI